MTDPAAAKVAPLQYRLSRLRRRLLAERAVFSIIILFLLLQKTFMRGLTAGAVKG